MVEFVSANPTGPMHMGNARGGVLGDTLANVLRRDGYDTWKEFYVNDAGNQINKFALSLQARYLQILLGEENVPFPEDGYQGEDIKELARASTKSTETATGMSRRRSGWRLGGVWPGPERPQDEGGPAPVRHRVR